MNTFTADANVRTESLAGKEAKISLLINSVYYFLECVFILSLSGYYRLIVYHNGEVLTDTRYATVRGARIAFSRMCGKKTWSIDVKAEWSRFYSPEPQWLMQKMAASTGLNAPAIYASGGPAARPAS